LQLGYKRAIIVGTDVPDLSSSVMSTALSLTESVDITLGDSGDGGYYLLGMASLQRVVFEGITYSTSSVLESTIQVRFFSQFPNFMFSRSPALQHHARLLHSTFFYFLFFKKIYSIFATLCVLWCQRAKDYGLAVAPLSSLPTFNDIDFADDLVNWVNSKLHDNTNAQRDPFVEFCRNILIQCKLYVSDTN
jgi:glycosyltransferase A (GT-A) superfamily protein (DUF2064 family)